MDPPSSPWPVPHTAAACSHSNSVGSRPPAQRAVRVGFVVAHVTDGFAVVDGPAPEEREDRPVTPLVAPVERRGPAVRLDGGPTVGEPQLRARVAAVGDERLPVARGDETARQAERRDECRVSRGLVVEREAVAVVPDVDDAALEIDVRSRSSVAILAGTGIAGTGAR